MAKFRKKKALYEVIGKSKGLPDYVKPELEKERDAEDKQDKKTEPEEKKKKKDLKHWHKRPVILQINKGRVDISVSVPIAVAFGLIILLFLIISFRMGIASAENSSPGEVKTSQQQPEIKEAKTVETEKKLETEEFEGATVQKPEGDNRIVITQYPNRADLVPVKQYFSNAGIETEIVRMSDRYFLLTKNYYENPSKPGTNGFEAKEKIKEIGADYEAPQGYETFGKTPFQDVYGMKFEK